MKVQNPIIGRAKGSAGGMTFSKVYDKNVARAKAFEVNNPKTQAQQTQRAFFTELTALCSDFSDDQLRFLFPQKPKTMSRRNALTKQIAESYEINGTTKSIDFSDINTLGNAPVMDFGIITLSNFTTNISVQYSELATLHPNLADNDVVAALINIDKGEISLTAESSTVTDGELQLAYPNGWSGEDNMTAILLVCTSKEGEVTTNGFGTVAVLNRPPRRNG